MEASFYTYLQANKGVFAVNLDCKSILKTFQFTEETADLKKALEKSIEECIATYVVDTLLWCNESVIKDFIEVLRKTDQAELVSLFETVDYNADKALFEYTCIKPCDTPIPHKAQQNLQLHYKQICQLLRDSKKLVRFTAILVDNCAISKQLRVKLENQDASLLLDTIINGNAYQYYQFKACATHHCEELLQYL